MLQPVWISRPTIRRVFSRTAQPSVEIDGISYHGTCDPVGEAVKFCAPYPIEKAEVMFQSGWGLGYSANPLLARMKRSARIIVFEPDEALFALTTPAADKRFQFVIGDQVRHFFDDWTLDVCQETDDFLWLVWLTTRLTSIRSSN